VKWLIVGTAARGGLESMYLSAFARVGVEAELLRSDLPAGIAPVNLPARLARRATAGVARALRRRRVLEFFETTKDRFDVVMVMKGLDLTKALIARCRALTPGAFWLVYNPDDPFNVQSSGVSNSDVVASIPLYDLYAIWSRALADRLLAAGAKRVLYLPFGFDRAVHPRASPELPRTKVVCFIGQWDPLREAALGALVGECDLRIYGNDWSRVRARSGLRERVTPRMLFGRELAEATAGAAIALNLLRPQNVGSHNMRSFEVPAMGGLLLTTRSAEQQAFLPEDEASFMFESKGELRYQVGRILAHPELAERVRARGGELVLAHDYEARARELVDAVRAFASTR